MNKMLFGGEMSAVRKNRFIMESYLQNAEFHIQKCIQTVTFLYILQVENHKHNITMRGKYIIYLFIVFIMT